MSMSSLSMPSFTERVIELQRGRLQEMSKEAVTRLRLAKNAPEAMGWLAKKSPALFGGADEMLRRMLNPIHGLKAGWKELTPRTDLLNPKKLKEMRSAIKAPRTWNPLTWLKPGEHMTEYQKTKISPTQILKGEFKGPHASKMQNQLNERGRMRMMAEEMSRRGWTGKGSVTKYLPVGGKSLMTGFSAQAIPQIVNAPKASRTGEGGALEEGLGGLGSAVGMVAGMGGGLVPGTAMWYAMDKGGRKAGRVLDRLRSGASMSEAVKAPSPSEAADQLSNIQQYYSR